VPIIEHPDVRRMLLWMKAMTDGMRSMVYSAAFWSDLALEMPEGRAKRHYQALTEFITPLVKAYCSDMGFRVCETAIQCLGGYGFCQEYHLEQYLRDVKIASLYEGTNGIQSIDLMSRKMELDRGAPYRAFMDELGTFCKKNRDHPVLGAEIRLLAKVRAKLARVAKEMLERKTSDPLQWASYTYPVLLCFGEATLAWRLLDMALCAQRIMDGGKTTDYYLGKVKQATFLAQVTLPLTIARLGTCVREGREIVEIPQGAF
ncbi:MAG: acyl-CoA dehydrogenase, partial [Deltaproteobacteria bacterium]|nr:acyl-CoA dehydrogenase [Deltaproteobacteria bacterium]